MKYFKVHFDDNMVSWAEALFDITNVDIINIAENNNKRTVEWIVVYAESEADAALQANKVLLQYSKSFGLSDL